jgi:hypothetical protein
VLLAFAGVALGSSLLCVAVFGWSECERFFFGALPLMLREPPTDLYRAENASLARWLMVHAGTPAGTARALGSAAAFALLLASLAATRGPKGAAAVRAHEMALFIPVTLLAMPNSWTNYQLLLLVPMAAVLGWSRGRPAREAAVPAGLVVVAFLWLTYHIDTYYYPLRLHLPPELSAFLHDNRFAPSVLAWLAALRVVRAERRAAR